MSVDTIHSLRQILEEGSATGRLLQILLAPLGITYGLCSALRYQLYRKGILKTHRADVPVISVGNLTAGGTGKTPFVLRLCTISKSLGKKPAVLTRGYGGNSPGESDEVKLLMQHLQEVYAGPDRVASAGRAVADGAELLILDDGFQHLKLHRDLDLVLIDATAPFGGGLPLPAGLLREFPGALKRADMVCLTHADQVCAEKLSRLQQSLGRRLPQTPLMTSSHEPVYVRTSDGEKAPPVSLAGKAVVAVAGIGRPSTFFRMLKGLEADIRKCIPFPDHHNYTPDNVEHLLQIAAQYNAQIVVTEKDMVKLETLLPEESRKMVLALRIAMEMADSTMLEQEVSRLFCKE